MKVLCNYLGSIAGSIMRLGKTTRNSSLMTWIQKTENTRLKVRSVWNFCVDFKIEYNPYAAWFTASSIHDRHRILNREALST